MIKVILLALFGTVFFFLAAFMRKWKDSPVLFAVSIGCACNANILTVFKPDFVIEIGPFMFGPDSWMFVMFMWTIVIMMVDYSVKQARVLMHTALAAIVISAIFEFCTYISAEGQFSTERLFMFLYYLISCIGTLLGCFFLFWLYGMIKVRNKYLFLLSGLVVTSFIHEAFFFLGSMLVYKDYIVENFEKLLWGGVIAKAFFMIIAILCYLLNSKVFIPNSGFKRQENQSH